MEHLMDFFLFIVAVGVGYALGTMIEVEHYAAIEKGEKEFLLLPAVSSKKIEEEDNIIEPRLVYGSVVISVDYFKRVLAMLYNLIGGRVKAYESLLDRGRREAILRMKKQAQLLGADLILNMRLETFTIGGSETLNGTAHCCEVLAYGTAVKLRDK